LGVRLLKCVGYDEAFQQEIHTRFQTWVSHEERDTKGKKGSKRRSRGRNAHVKQEDDVSASDDSGNVTEMDSDNDDEEDENDVRNVVYVSAGTKTRPRK